MDGRQMWNPRFNTTTQDFLFALSISFLQFLSYQNPLSPSFLVI